MTLGSTELMLAGFHLGAHLMEPGKKPRQAFLKLEWPSGRPLVSCIMATRGRLFPARFAIDCFRRQSWPHRELVVICAAADSEVERYVADLADPAIRFHRAAAAITAGALRNEAIALAEGELLSVWDDDDLSHPDRLAKQIFALQAFDVAASLLARELLWWPSRRQLAISSARLWENTLLARRAAMPPYPDLVRSSDTHVAARLRTTERLVMIDHPASYCYVFHGANLWNTQHFEMLVSTASAILEGERYEAALAELAPSMPFADYAAGLADAAPGVTISPDKSLIRE